MQQFFHFPRSLISLAVLVVVPLQGAQLKNPYEILGRYYDAIGGLENLKAENTTVMVAEVEIVGTGLSGTLKQWESRPVKNRQELDLKVFRQVTGDNGESAWVLDTNGKLKLLRDEETVKGREIRRRMANFEHLDPDSPHFTVTLDGTEKVEGQSCYRIRIANDLLPADQVLLINTKNFLLAKSIQYTTSGSENHTTYADYRDVGGVLHSFRQSMVALPVNQQQEIRVTLVETNVDLDPAIFDPPSVDVEDFAFLDGNRSEDIPIRFHENHIFVQVTMNCDKRWWVLDSGAGMTAIDTAYARQLGLELEGKLTGQGVNNTMDISFTTLPAYSVQGVELNPQKAVALDIERLFGQLSDIPVAGILGYDFMSRFVTRIDYANELMSLYHPGEFAYTGDGTVVDAPLNGSNMFTVPMTVEGEMSGQWRFDTGASGTGFHFDFAEKNGLLDRPGIDRQHFGAGGSHVSRLVPFRKVEIAGFELPSVLISVPPEAGQGALAEKSLIGNLGSNLFRNFTIYLDYARQQIIFEKGDDFGKEFPEDRSGLQIWHPGGAEKVEIRFVASGTPADRAGFRVGDEIRAINDIPVQQLDGLSAVRELMQAPAGVSYTVSIARGNEVLHLKLDLADLFAH